jgi:transcription elongation factor/antiterminator RfaH
MLKQISWFCIYTKRKQEDAVCQSLTRLEHIETFNPKLQRKKSVRGKVIEVVEHLFPCYLFCGFEESGYFHKIRYTRGVKRFVGDQAGRPREVDEGIIDLIRSRMNAAGYVCIESPKLEPGEQVMIKEGPLSGLSGLLLSESKPGERVTLLLNAILYQARVEVPSAFVEKKRDECRTC